MRRTIRAGQSGWIAAWAVAGSLLAAGTLLAQTADAPATPTAPGQYVWILNQTDCRDGLWRQPGGPFAAIVFCEQRLGTYLAIAYFGSLPEPSGQLEGWSVRDLTWQEHPWATDITSFAWAPDGRRLLVATADGEGAGALYEIDLRARTARQVVPADSAVTSEHPGLGYIIDRLDIEKQILYYRPLPWNAPVEAAEGDSLLLSKPLPSAPAPAPALAPAPAASPAPPPAPKAKTTSKPPAKRAASR